MENPLTIKKLLNEDIQEIESEFRFLSFYKKQNYKKWIIIIISLLFILFLLILFFFLIFKPNNNTNMTNELKIANEQNVKNKQNIKNEQNITYGIEMKNFSEISKSFPFSLIINDNGKISTDDNCFDDISSDKIKYEKEAFFNYDLKYIEENSQISTFYNICISLIGDIISFFSDFLFKVKIDSVFQVLKSHLHIIVKSQISSLSIKRKNIKFDDLFINKIKKIGLDESYNDEEKASLLNNIFKSYGYYIPLKIYFGGYFYLEVDKIKYQKNKEFIDELISNANINFDNKLINDTSDDSISYKSFFSDLFYYENINIIGGDITKNTLDEWKDSLNDNNPQIVEYENLISIPELLNDILDNNTLKQLSKPFNLINEKYELRRKYYDYLKQAKNYDGNNQISGNFDYKDGICEQNKLIYSERFKHTEKSIKFQKYYDDIIVGFEIIENWKDGTNGEYTLQNPIFKKYISISFKGKFLRDISFDIIIYLLKNPDKITIN